MKSFKTMLALILAGILLLLSGCGSNSDESKDGSDGSGNLPSSNLSSGNSGRYREKDVTPEGESVLDLLKTADGKLILYTEGMLTRYDSADGGETWDKSDGPGKSSPELANARNLAVMDNGDILAVVTMDDRISSDKIYRIKTDGTVEEAVITEYNEITSDGVYMINTLAALPDNRVLLYAFDSSSYIQESTNAEGENSETDGNFVTSDQQSKDLCAVYDLETGEKAYDLLDFFVSGSVVYDDTYFYADGFDGGISVRNLSDGKEARTIGGTEPDSDAQFVSSEFSISQFDIAPDRTGYVQNNKGFYQKNMETGEETKLMESATFSIGAADMMVSRFYALDQSAFITLCETENGAYIYKYTYDADAKMDPDQVLKIWTLTENQALRSAINAFAQQYPDSTIELEVALQSENAQETSDAIQSLNTRMLADDGPDIILLDGTPLESYAEKGMLMDLSEELDTSDMYSRFVEQFTTDEKINYIPTRFKAPVLMTSEALTENLNTLESLVNQVESGNDLPISSGEDSDPFAALEESERPMFGFESFDEVYELFWNSSANEFLQDNTLNTQTLGEWMELLKKVTDKYQIMDESVSGSSGAMMISSGSSGETITGNLMNYMSDRSNAAGYLAGGLSIMRIAQQEDTVYQSFPGLSQGSYLPQAIIGVSANSKRKDFAVEFIQNMISEKSQSSSGGGFPVTGNGYDAQLKSIEEMEVNGIDMSSGFTFDMESFVSGLETPVLLDDTIKAVIKDGVEIYCNGEEDLSSVLSKIETSTKTYLAERV